MHWVLQSNLFIENSYRDLVEQLERQKVPFDVVKIVPFIGDIIPDVNPEGPVFVCGSTAMKKLAVRKGWTPGYFDENVDMRSVIENWGDLCLNVDGYIAKIGEVTPRAYGKFHIRPVDDKKSFAGVVMPWKEFEEWRDKLRAMGKEENSLGTMDIDTEVVISPVQQILAEYRFFIVDGRVVTSSMYKQGTRVVHSPNVDRRIDWFVSDLVSSMPPKRWVPCRAFVVDIADTPNGLKVIECNSINSSGFYACDMGKFVAAINDMRF